MKVAAYQAPLLPSGSMEAIGLIREQVKRCEADGVEILCCPEAVLGGLADDAARPTEIAIDLESGRLAELLGPLASDAVTTIIGFTESTASGVLYNTAAVLQKGVVVGSYRKMHPAIRKSIYRAGERIPVFTVNGSIFGIALCNDSNFAEPARTIASSGASALFIPTNNGLSPEKADVVARTRGVDLALAAAHCMAIIRADVSGRADGRISHGSSEIVERNGGVLRSARPFVEELLVAEVTTEKSGEC